MSVEAMSMPGAEVFRYAAREPVEAQKPVEVVGVVESAEVADAEAARAAVSEAFGVGATIEIEANAAVSIGIADQPAAARFSPAHAKPHKGIRAVGTKVATAARILKELAFPPKTLRRRAATTSDVETLVDVDMAAFEEVYDKYEQPHDVLRKELIVKFTERLHKVGGRWVTVSEKDGEVGGFMMSCPTSKTPEEFESWEKTTDDGTLATTYDPDGNNVYVVSLSMLPGKGEEARNMLFAKQIGTFIKGGYERAFFESRMPDLKGWVESQGFDPETLGTEQRAELAKEYYGLTIERHGKEVPYDHLMRIYHRAGCKFVKLVPDAYQDAESMNFGAVAIYENPLPAALRKNRVARTVAGTAVQIASRSPKLMKMMF